MLLVALLSSDGRQFSIDKSIARMSETVCRLFEVFNDVEDDEKLVAHPIPLSNVTSSVLEKVLEYCTHQQCEGDRNEEDNSEWAKRYLEISKDALFDLILAANYLDVSGLLELTCKHVADMIKGKSPDDIRKVFGIENDLTPEDEHQIVKETAWINLTSSLRKASLSEDSSNEPFPLLDLPNEIISLILRQMHAVDRLRTRGNGRLYRLEENDHFSIKELSIGRYYEEDSKFHSENADGVDEVELSLIGPCSSYIDVLAKFASNTTIETVFFLCDEEERQLIPFVKALRAREIIVTMSKKTGRDEIKDSNIDEWTRDKSSLNIQMGGHAITGEALFRVYSEMDSGVSSLRRFRIDVLADAARSVLNLLGISYTRGLFTSRRNDAQFFVDDDVSKSFFIVDLL